jgi:hypothetical protein
MKVAGLVILAAIALALLTGSCSGVEFFTYTGDPFTLAESGSTSTSALTSNQLPPPPPPSAAIHRAARPAVWAAGVCGAVEAWATNWESRTREVNQHLVSANGIPAEEARDLYVDFWGETATKTDLLLREMDAAGRPAVRGGEGVARAYRLVFAQALPPMQMAHALTAALPDDPERVSAGIAEIRSNMARASDVFHQDMAALRAKLDRTLSGEVRAAFFNNTSCWAF